MKLEKQGVGIQQWGAGLRQKVEIVMLRSGFRRNIKTFQFTIRVLFSVSRFPFSDYRFPFPDYPLN